MAPRSDSAVPLWRTYALLEQDFLGRCMRWEAGWSREAGKRALNFETSSADTFQGRNDTARETWQVTVAGDYGERMHNAAPGAKKHIALRFLHPLFYVGGKSDHDRLSERTASGRRGKRRGRGVAT